MTKVSIVLILMLAGANLSAQQWLQPSFSAAKQTNNQQGLNFYQIQQTFRQYEVSMKTKGETEAGEEDEGEFPGYNQYKRWEWFNEQRVFPSGNFPSVMSLLREYKRFKAGSGLSPLSSTWVNLSSPTVPIGNSAGTGRVNCMAFMPGNVNTIFIGTACGGVWKSTNAGGSWTLLNTDQLPSLSIADIAINPKNTNIIYIATGDNYAGIPGLGKSLQGHFSAGIFKSLDGGGTWSAVGPSYTQAQYYLPQRLIVHPTNPDTLFMASNVGIQRSLNGGLNWTTLRNGTFYSIEFNPLNPAVIFATDGLGLWRSDNNGGSWTYKGGSYPNTVGSRLSLAVTPSDTNYVYIWGPTAGFKRSVLGGASLTTMTSPDALVNPYGYYDRGIAASPVNKLEVTVTGNTTGKTIDGGTSWNASSEYTDHTLANYIHQDVKKIVYQPGSGTIVYALTDGGIYRTNDGGTTWFNISAGLQIGEIYRVANHPSSADTILYGNQDCASNRITLASSTITEVSSGDGMQPLYDYQNPQTVFVCKPYGNMQKSTDWGNTFTVASAGQASWVSSFVMNPVNPKTMYCGTWAGVKKSYDEGTFLTWNNISAGVIDTVISVAVTAADTNYVYAAKFIKMVKSSDGGTTWTDVTGILPVASAAISYITVSPTDTALLFVSFSGYSAGNKVFKSSDAGKTWTNYSGTLPNVPVNSITYVKNTDDVVFIATDFGVLYRYAGSSDWTAFNTGLPNVIVNHLDVFYPTGKLRSGTYGRGLWQADLPTPATPVVTAGSSTTFCSGSTVTLTSSSATGNQWYKNNVLIAGATNATLVVSTSGNYTVVVTVSGFRSAVSNVTVVNAGCPACTWTGTLSTDWSTTGNWNCGYIPDNIASDVTIPSAPINQPVLSANISVHDITIQPGALVDLNGKTMLIQGAVAGTGTFKGSLLSGMTINGTAGTLRFATGYAILQTLQLNNNSSATIGTKLSVTPLTGKVTVNAGGVLYINGSLVIGTGN